MRTDVICPACGSADVVRMRATDADQRKCLRCDHVFTPRPCPNCGSFDLTGALGVSGMHFERPSVVVTCLTCKEEFPPHPSVTA